MERFWRYVQGNQKPTMWTWLGLLFGTAWSVLIISELRGGLNTPTQWVYLIGGICILCASGADLIPATPRWSARALRLLASTLLVVTVAALLFTTLLG